MHAATVLFGVSGILGKLCQSSAPVLVCGRALFAVAALGLLCLSRHEAPWRGLNRRDLTGLALSGALLTVHFVTFFQAIKLGGVAVGTLGFACFPAFTTLFEALAYRERPTAAELWGLAAVSLGLICLTPAFSLNSSATHGLLWAVLSGAVYALVAVSMNLLNGFTGLFSLGQAGSSPAFCPSRPTPCPPYRSWTGCG